MASSLVWWMIAPSAAAIAATSPTVTPGSVELTASAVSVKPGQSVTFTASASDPGGTALYQFWVEMPNGQWENQQNYSTDPTFVLSNVSAGNYLVAVEVMDQAQVQHGQWSQAQTTLPDGVFVGSQVAAVSLNQDAAPGSSVTLQAEATGIYQPLYQFWVEAPDGTWSQSGAYSSAAAYTFKPGQPGIYHFVAYAKSPEAANNPHGALQSAVGSSGVYGTASQVVLSLASPTVVADGQATDTLIATVEDQYGNRVPAFTGSLVLNAGGSSDFLVGDDHNATETANVVGGTATATVQLPSGDVGPTVITVDQLTTLASYGFGGVAGQGQAANVTYGSATLSGVANTPFDLTLTSSLPSLSDNTINATQVTVGINDQAGDPYVTKNGRYVTLTLTGPGSFASGSVVQTVSEHIAGGTTTGTVTVPVYSREAVAGTIMVSATASGIVPASPLAIATYETGAPAGLAITSSNGFDRAGDVYTLYTVDVVDQQGHLITTGSGSADAIQVADNEAAMGNPELFYYTGDHLHALVSGQATTATLNDGGTTVANPVVTDLTASGGQVQFAVENGYAGFGLPTTITTTDLATGASASGVYNYYLGSQLGVRSLSPLTLTVPLGGQPLSGRPQSVLAGQILPMSMQLTDQFGNPLPEKGVPVWFTIIEEATLAPPTASPYSVFLDPSFPAASGLVQLPNGASSSGDTYEAYTNSSGIATINVTVPSGDAAYDYGVVVAHAGAGRASGEQFLVMPPQYQPASLAWTGGLPTSGRLGAGQSATVSAGVFNALGSQLALESANPFNYALLTSSNSGVVVPAGAAWTNYAAQLAPGEWLINAGLMFKNGVSEGPFVLPLMGEMAGTTTLTLQDLAPGVPPISENLTVVPGPAVGSAAVLYNGAPVSSSNPLELASNVPVPITLVNVDAGGNPLPVAGQTAATVTLPTSLAGVAGSYNWEPAGGGAAITSVEIPPGQSSATVWFVSSASQVVSTFPSELSD
ncbi:MAG: hypothetical protein M0Z54_10915 [Thermaerobacter sp.]|nr:hypothetical protein [Thermaerobacter sp.]